jgi:aminopeptidase N
MVLLREQILGPERFDWAFRKFIRDWSNKHPSLSDFFRAMESEGGEDLAWFWRGWFMNNWTLDLAIQSAEYVNGDFHQGAKVTIANRGQLVMPSTVAVNFEDGSSTRVILPVEAWIQRTVYMMHVDSSKPIVSIVVDPDHVIPDADRSNNEFKLQAGSIK